MLKPGSNCMKLAAMSPNIRHSFISLLRGCWEATTGERPRFFLFIFLFILSYSLDLITPYAIGKTLAVFVEMGMVDEAFRQGMFWIGIYTLLRLCSAVLHHTARYLQNRVSYSSRMYAMNKIFGAFLRFPLRWHVSHHSGENLSKLHRSVGAVDGVIGTYVWQVIEGMVKVVFAGIAIFAIDFWVAVAVLALSAVTIAVMVLFNAKLTKKIRINNTFGNKLNRILVDYLVNIVTVKTLGVEGAARKYLGAQRNEGLVIAQKISKYSELKWGATGIGSALVIGTSLAIYFNSHRGDNTPVDVAKVYVLLNYLDRIFQAIGSFTGYYSALIEASTAYEDATAVFDDNQQLGSSSALAEVRRDWSSISLRGVHFSYVSGDRVGLNDVSFDFKRGEKVALVGQSGSGKSTLLKILAGLIEPDSYSLSSDIQENIGIESFAKTTLLIPQEPEIFSETVIYNLTMGEESDQKETSFFISLCKLDLLLSKLPEGWNSNLAEKGLNLSVGEKQRIALARGLLKASGREVLLLDEPTSSLDPKTEKEIYLGLLYHFTGRTVFSSCHRLHLIPLFDKIVFMAHSKVLEVGSFPELLDRKGHFFKAWEDYERGVKMLSAKSPGDEAST